MAKRYKLSGADATRVAKHMRRALRLARSGTGATYPNPCVGAVVARGDQVLGAARSGATGKAHAEVRALKKAGAAARGADMYVTLEPCCHTGRTPPCTQAIIDAGIKRVFICVQDPAAAMRGKGAAKLRRAGLEVHNKVLVAEGDEVHAHYLHHLATGRPYVTLKVATSVDGYIATHSGHSQWISGPPARRHAHMLRARHHGIAVGATTLLTDNPQLNVRMVRGVDPQPIIFDTRLSVFEAGRRKVSQLHLLREGTWFVHTSAAPMDLRRRARGMGIKLIQARSARSHVNIGDALDKLGALDLRSLMVEGGGRMLGAFVGAQAAQELHFVRAPVLLGEGRPAFAGLDFGRVPRAPRLQELSQKRLGVDLLTVYRL